MAGKKRVNKRDKAPTTAAKRDVPADSGRRDDALAAPAKAESTPATAGRENVAPAAPTKAEAPPSPAPAAGAAGTAELENIAPAAVAKDDPPAALAPAPGARAAAEREKTAPTPAVKDDAPPAPAKGAGAPAPADKGQTATASADKAEIAPTLAVKDDAPPAKGGSTHATPDKAASAPAAKAASAGTDHNKGTIAIDLALQGGGAHGAFTWGVLDRLLQEKKFRIEAISGTSAGAMNAALLITGWSRDGAEGARAALDAFWLAVSQSAIFSPIQRSLLDRMLGRWSVENSPGYVALKLMQRVFSPYDLNPIGFNPLRALLQEHVDFTCLAASPIKLFVTATSVRSGRGRVFRNGEVTVDVLLASSCLPALFQAVEIGGEYFWDGGFVGNPTITPLVRESDAHDTLLVQINPPERSELPRSADEIADRITEISFNSPLMKELRMIALLRQVADPGQGEGARWAGMRIHRIMTNRLAEFGVSSKLNAEWGFLSLLKAEGQRCAEEFLERHGSDVGRISSADIDALLTEC